MKLLNGTEKRRNKEMLMHNIILVDVMKKGKE